MSKYLFVDAGCLHFRVRQFEEKYGSPVEVNWWSIAAGYRKIFYYDAFPVREDGEEEAKYNLRVAPIRELHEKLAALDRFRVYEGDARTRRGAGRQQKKVDVMIAVDMLIHTIRRNMEEASLLASDVDFKPLLDALVTEGMFVTLIYNPKSTNRELLASADARVPMTDRQIYNWLDDVSKTRVPFPSVSGHSHQPNFHEGETMVVWSDERHGEVALQHLAEADRFRVIWKERGSYMSAKGCDLRVMRLALRDERQIEIPTSFHTRAFE